MTKVAHFCYSAGGGAGRAALRAHLASLEAGVDSVFFHQDGAWPGATKMIPDFTGVAESEKYEDIFNILQDDYVGSRRTRVSDTLFSICFPGLDLRKSEFFRDIDVYHFHWTSWMITPATVGALLAAGKKVVWTLHDMWPFTGGCHYSSGCRQYETCCNNCPQLRDDGLVVPQMWEEKRKSYGARYFPNFTVITPSRWLGHEASKSEVFRKATIKVVPNPIEHDVFCPVPDRGHLRRLFGLDDHDQVILFGNFDNSEKRKGVEVLRIAIEAVLARHRDLEPRPKGRLVIALFGKGEVKFPDQVPVLNFSELRSNDQLRDAYNIADVFVHPSLEDNYPNTVLEAMACGTPVVGFDTGGMSDMVGHGSTGLLCRKVGSTEELANAVLDFLTVHLGDSDMRNRCVSSTFANSFTAVGQQLRDIYVGGEYDKDYISKHDRKPPAQALTTLQRTAVPVDIGLGELTREFATLHSMAKLKLPEDRT